MHRKNISGRKISQFLAVTLALSVSAGGCGPQTDSVHTIDSSVQQESPKETETQTTKETETQSTKETETRSTKNQSSASQEKAEHSYSVSTSSDIATDVGMAILEKGGNAADAAIAVAFTLGVVEPYASGIGGSGGMIIYDTQTEEVKVYDYRAESGSASSKTDNVCIPGLVSGMYSVWQEYGSLSWEELLQPAIDYAADGFKVNNVLGTRINAVNDQFADTEEFLNTSGNYLAAGDTMIQSSLAETLTIIQEQGEDGFYSGSIAEDIAAACGLTVDDLAGYETIVSEPVYGTYLGNTIISSGAPFSGTTLIQELELSEQLNMASPEEDIDTYLQQLKQITELAVNDRYQYLGDTRYCDFNAAEHVDASYTANLLGIESSDSNDDDEEIETTSFSIAETDGLVISCTNTLSSFWGSKTLVDGIFLNNTGSNFGSGVNKYHANKRSRTYTSPTIIVKEDGSVYGIGTPGGNNIPGILFSVITSVLRDGEDPQQAIDQGRIFYRKGELFFESGLDLEKRINTGSTDENIAWRKTGQWFGSVSFAGIEGENVAAAFDSRRGATKCGVHNAK